MLPLTCLSENPLAPGVIGAKTRITRTDSPMTSVATALRVHRDRRSRSSVYSMRTESPCDCTGLPAPSARRAPASRVCTKAKEIGRSLAIGPHDEVLRRHCAWMSTSVAQEAYRSRGCHRGLSAQYHAKSRRWGIGGIRAATPYIHGADKIPALVAVASDMPGPFVVAFVRRGKVSV